MEQHIALKRSTKLNKIIYWVATALFTFGMLMSGIQQIIQSKAMVDLITPLGYPSYLLPILGVWKVLGVIAILVPGFKLVKEWAYAGFFFTMTGALFSHLATGDHHMQAIIGPIMQTVFIVLSWHFRPEERRISIVK